MTQGLNYDLDSTKKDDLEYLHEKLVNTNFSDQAKTRIIIKVLEQDLFRLPFWLRVFVRRNYRKFIIYMSISKKGSDFLENFWKQILNHMVNGTDDNNFMSAGGWNQTELNAFLAILKEEQV